MENHLYFTRWQVHWNSYDWPPLTPLLNLPHRKRAKLYERGHTNLYELATSLNTYELVMRHRWTHIFCTHICYHIINIILHQINNTQECVALFQNLVSWHHLRNHWNTSDIYIYIYIYKQITVQRCLIYRGLYNAKILTMAICLEITV